MPRYHSYSHVGAAPAPVPAPAPAPKKVSDHLGSVVHLAFFPVKVAANLTGSLAGFVGSELQKLAAKI